MSVICPGLPCLLCRDWLQCHSRLTNGGPLIREQWEARLYFLEHGRWGWRGVKIIVEATLEGLISGLLLVHDIFLPGLEFCRRRNLAPFKLDGRDHVDLSGGMASWTAVMIKVGSDELNCENMKTWIYFRFINPFTCFKSIYFVLTFLERFYRD